MNLDKTIQGLEKRFGDGFISTFTNMEFPDVEVIPTGSLALDYAIGGGLKFAGVPLGRLTLLWGPKGAGKSTLTYHVIAEAQKMGISPALIDYEFSFDDKYAKACGIDLDNLLFVRPWATDTGEMFSAEDAWEIVDNLIRSKEVKLIVIDSEDAMRPRREIQGEYGESHMGLKAKLNAQAMGNLKGPLKINDTALLLVKQHRYSMKSFGNSETMSGGEGLKHAADVRIDMRIISQEKESGSPVGVTSRCYIRWNKIAPPCETAELQIRFGEGISKEAEIRDFGSDLDIYTKRGTYYYFEGEDGDYVQGKASAVQFLKDNPELAQELERKIRAKLNQGEEDDKNEQDA